MESIGALIQSNLTFWSSAFVLFWDGSWAVLVSSPLYPFNSNSFIAPHPFVPVLLKSPHWQPICTSALIDSRSQSSLIGESFAIQNFLPRKPLDQPLPVQGLNGNNLGSGCITHIVPTNLCIEDHSKFKDFGVV